MNKLSIMLLSSSALVGSMLLMLLGDKPANAGEPDSPQTLQKTEKAPTANLDCSRSSCTGNAHLASWENMFNKENGQETIEHEFRNLEQTPEGHLILEFTEEESNAAIEMYGCDCPKALNALRQSRGVAIGVEGNVIIPGPPIKPCNQPISEISG